MSENKVRAIEALNMWREGGSISTQFVLDIIIKTVKEEVPEWTFSAEIRPSEPQLIQGYTAEQWQEIIDGGYLCEFSGSGNKATGLLESVKDDDYQYPFQQVDGSNWSNCRPAQIKGVMRPIFVEPVDKGEMICMFTAGGFPLNNIRSRISYDAYRLRENTDYSDATKYIEL